MSPLLKLAAFAAGLAALFGVATLAGAAIDPDRDDDRPAAHREMAETNADMANHGGADGAHGGADGAHGGAADADHGADDAHGGGHDADAVRGLATVADGLRLVVVTPQLERGEPGTVRFRIENADGEALRGDDFDVTHERKMHLIVVRRDLGGFQHLHPELAADGTWSAPLTLPQAGSYRLFADFSHDGEAQTLASDLRVDGDATLRALPAPATTATSAPSDDPVTLSGAGHLRAGEETTLQFAIERDGEPARIEPYLGADGHLVALREGDLAFLHVHPTGAGPAFATTFPSAGRYRLFLQYKVAGRVETAAFTVEVER